MAKKLDIVDYFKLYEKKWWEEGNKEEITVETIKDVGDIFGLNEAILTGKNKKVEEDDKGVNMFGSSEVSDVEDEDDDSEKIETLSILFRAVAELEVYNFDTIDDIRTYAQNPFTLEEEYKTVLKTMWKKNANKKHNVMKKKEMSILLKNMLKKEQQDKETLLKSIGISKDRITLGVEKACKREIKNAQMRSSNNAFVAKQFTEQKDEIMEKINASYKLYKDTLDGNFKKIKNDIYKYYISNIDMYSEEMLFQITKVAKQEYQILGPHAEAHHSSSNGNSKSIKNKTNETKRKTSSKDDIAINFTQFILCFIPCLDIVFTGSRYMVDQGYLHPSLFEFSRFQKEEKKSTKKNKKMWKN